MVMAGDWQGLVRMPRRQYKCGHCGKDVASIEGYVWKGPGEDRTGLHFGITIYLCGGCNRPTYFEGDVQIPAPLMGNDVEALPEPIAAIYQEARQCTQVGAYTACVLICRKLLMHIAVQQGAPENQNFYQYVNYLAEQGYVPPRRQSLGRPSS